MPEQQLSIRSTRARKLAHKLAKRERRTVSQVVERALETYEKSNPAAPKESLGELWLRLARESALVGGEDIDLEAVIREGRKPHLGIDL